MMIEERERRIAPRRLLPDRLAAWVRGLRAVHLLDLSLAGALIEHLGVFRHGAPCALDLPPRWGSLSLAAQVVWSTVIERTHPVGRDSHLVARSGLRFTMLTGAQHATLAECLQQLGTAPRPGALYPALSDVASVHPCRPDLVVR